MQLPGVSSGNHLLTTILTILITPTILVAITIVIDIMIVVTVIVTITDMIVMDTVITVVVTVMDMILTIMKVIVQKLLFVDYGTQRLVEFS